MPDGDAFSHLPASFGSQDWYIDLSEYSACGGWIEYSACVCGTYSGVSRSFPSNQYTRNEYTDEQGRQVQVRVYTCTECGLRYEDAYYRVNDYENCRATEHHMVTVTVGDVFVADMEYDSHFTAHDTVREFVLMNGEGSSCADGVIANEKCKNCDYENSYEYYHHETHEIERIDLTQYGSVCGSYAVVTGCVCGYNRNVNLEGACEYGSESCVLWIENVLTESQPTVDGWYSVSRQAYLYTCSVSDPACAFKIRYARFYQKAEDECRAYRYEIWQLGYDEETGTCQREIVIQTGSIPYHNYVYVNENNSQKYDCADCGSYYYRTNYYDEQGRVIKTEEIANNTLNDGAGRYCEDIWEYAYDSDGSQYQSRYFYKFIYADGRETWNEHLTVPYEEVPFGDGAYKSTTNSMNANGIAFTVERVYVVVNGIQLDIYLERHEGDTWYRQEYTYSFEDGCVRTIRYTNNYGADTTETMNFCGNYGLRYVTKVKPTCTQDGIRGDECIICGKLFTEETVAATDHSWVTVTDGWYYCFNCGLESENGVSGDIVLEDLSEQYGNGDFYVVGYYARNNVAFTQYVSLLLASGEEVILDVEVLPMDNVRAFSFSKAAVKEAAKDYTDYLIRFAFVPEGADGSLDYAITFEETDRKNNIANDVSFTDYVGEGIANRYTLVPEKDGFWIFTCYANRYLYAYLYDANGNLLVSDTSGKNGYNYNIVYQLKAGETYYFEVKWNNTNYAGQAALVFDANVSVDDVVSEDLVFTSNGDNTCYVSGFNSWDSIAVIIPSTYNGDVVTGIGEGAFRDRNITSVYIPDSVTYIGNNAFQYCYNLSAVEIPNSVISIGQYAFWNCNELVTIEIPDSVTTIGEGAFGACNGLTSVKIGSGVTEIGNNAFSNNNSLTEIIIAEGNTAYNMAGNCLIETESKTLIRGFANSVIPTDGSVTSIAAGAFEYCAGLTELVIPEGIVNMDGMAVAECPDLVSVSLPASLNNINSYCFPHCPKLVSITVAEGNENYCSVDGVVYSKDMTKLIRWPEGKADVTIPESVTYIPGNAFLNCTHLTEVFIPANVTSIGFHAFSDCDNLMNIYVDENNETFCSIDGILCTENGTVLWICPAGKSTVVVPETVVRIEYGAFYCSDTLTTVIIPVSVTEIRDTAFYNSFNLTNVCYAGTEEQWNAITFGYNHHLDRATKYFNYDPNHTHAASAIGNLWNEDLVCAQCGTILASGRSMVKHLAFDSLALYSGGENKQEVFTPGYPGQWDGVLYLQDATIDELCFWGWVALDKEPGQFGYSINGNAPVFDDAWTYEADQAVHNAAANYGASAASRMKVMIPTADLKDFDTVYVLYKDANGVVVILRSFTIRQPGPVENPENGSLEAPLTVSQTLSSVAGLEEGVVTDMPYYTTGVVTEIGQSSTYYKNVYITDGEQTMLVYTVNPMEGMSELKVGDTITVFGYIKNYNGTIEFASKIVDDASVYVYIVAHEPAPEEPAPEIIDKAAAGMIAESCDTVLKNDELYFSEDGQAYTKLAAVDNTITVKSGDVLGFRGWIGFNQAIDEFGYIVNDGEFISAAEFTQAAEEAVRIIAGENASRYLIMVSTEGTAAGNYTFTWGARLADGTIASFYTITLIIE